MWACARVTPQVRNGGRSRGEGVFLPRLGAALGDLDGMAAAPPAVGVLVEQLLHRWVGSGRLATLAELQPSMGDLHVEVGLGPSGQLLEHAVFADRSCNRLVHVVVPAGRRLWQRHGAALLQAKKVAVAEDVLEDLVVTAEAAAFQARLRPRAMELSRLEEGCILGRTQQRRRVELGSQRGTGAHLDDASVDGGASQAPSDRDAMVSVDHVVAVADFVDIDRRQLVAFDHLLVDACPAVAHTPVDRQESGVEVACLRRRRRRAHHLVQRYLLHAAKSPALEASRFEHRLDGLKPARAPGQDGADRPPEGAEAGSVEVLECPDVLQCPPLTLALSPRGEREIYCYSRASSLSA